MLCIFDYNKKLAIKKKKKKDSAQSRAPWENTLSFSLLKRMAAPMETSVGQS